MYAAVVTTHVASYGAVELAAIIIIALISIVMGYVVGLSKGKRQPKEEEPI